jgi:hypothetical protein
MIQEVPCRGLITESKVDSESVHLMRPMMGCLCECANRRKISLTLGPETTTREQIVPCPVCNRPLLSSLGGRVILKVTIDHLEGAEGWPLPV